MAQRWQPKRHTRRQRRRCPTCKRARELRNVKREFARIGVAVARMLDEINAKWKRSEVTP